MSKNIQLLSFSDFVDSLNGILPESVDIKEWVNEQKDSYKESFGDNFKRRLYADAWLKYREKTS